MAGENENEGVTKRSDVRQEFQEDTTLELAVAAAVVDEIEAQGGELPEDVKRMAAEIDLELDCRIPDEGEAQLIVPAPAYNPEGMGIEDESPECRR